MMDLSRSMTEVEIYTMGDCHLLAREIHRLIDWPMAALVDEHEPDLADQHAFVLTPWDTALDITGEQDPDQLAEEWGMDDWAIFSCEYFEEDWGTRSEFGVSWARTRAVAKRLVAEALENNCLTFGSRPVYSS